MPTKGIATLIKIVSDPGIIIDEDSSIAEAVNALRPDGAAGILDLVYLIKDLLAARNGAIGYALAVARNMPPSKQLIDMVREVGSASALAPCPPLSRFRGEIVGPGQVGWLSSTHARIIEQAAAVLARLESATQSSVAEPPPEFSPIPHDATVIYKFHFSNIEDANYLRSLDWSPSAKAWLLHYERYPADPSTHYAETISEKAAYQFLLRDIRHGVTSYREESREALERHFLERLSKDGVTFPDRMERCPECNGRCRTKSGHYCGNCKGEGWLDPRRCVESKSEAQRPLPKVQQPSIKAQKKATKPWWRFW